MALHFAIALGIGIVIGVALYNYVTGESLLYDWVFAVRVRRADIAALDRAMAASTTRSDIIISLTTVPSRLPFLGETLKSLLLQTRPPREIRLNLPYFSKRENRPYEIPDWLSALASVRIHRCEDIGPATKFMASLMEAHADQPILVLDDDRIYPPNLIAELEKAARAQPDAAIGTGGWLVPHDLVDRPTNYGRFFPGPPAPMLGTMIRRAKEVDILKGVSGYLVRPRFFDLSLLSDFSGAPPDGFFADDIWLSGHCRARKIVIPMRYGDFTPKPLAAHFRDTSLGRLDKEKRRNTATLRYFDPSCWRVGGPHNLAPSRQPITPFSAPLSERPVRPAP